MSVLRKLIQKLKVKLKLVSKRKKRLKRIELKLRSMRKIAIMFKDDDSGPEKKKELTREFNRLQDELNELNQNKETKSIGEV